MGSAREILSLQFGNYANYVGQHWWNIQESAFNYDTNAEPSNINHDVLFREGKTLKNVVTYTPRLLLVDLKGSMKHMSENGELYCDDYYLNTNYAMPSASATEEGDNNDEDDPEIRMIGNNIDWDTEKVEVIKEAVQEKPEYLKDLSIPESSSAPGKSYDFANTATSWTDFSYSRYHPRTANILNDFEHSATENAFDTYSLGMDMWKRTDFQDDFTDKIRAYLEECDNCQGFQTLFDCTDGFSGFTLKCYEHLQDEYSKTVFAIPLIPARARNFKNSDDAMSDSIRLINIAMAYANMPDFASLIVPLSTMSRGWRQIGEARKFPHLDYKSDNYYQTSAILATFLETISLRYRLRHSYTFLPGFCSDMTNYGKKMSGAGLALPFRMNNSEDLIDCLDRLDGPIFTQLSPNTDIGTDRIIQNVCVRGIPQTRLKQPLQLAQRQMKMAAYSCNSVSEMFQLYFQCNNYSSLSHVVAVEKAMEVKTPYPHEIFSNQLTGNGFLSEFEQTDKPNLLSVPTIATVQTSNDLFNTLESLHRDVSRIKIKKIHRFLDAGMEVEEYDDNLGKLIDFKEQYDDNYEL